MLPEQIAEEYGLTLEEAQEALRKLDAVKKEMPALTKEHLESLEFKGRCILAKEFTVKGFEHFFWCYSGMELPPHARTEWIPALFAQKEHGKMGTLIEAFRESAKTVTITNAFVAFFIGHHPNTASMIVQVGDDSAKKNSAKVAEIIETSGAWKEIFPNVVPDKEKGWGDRGYEVKRTDVTMEEWQKMNADRKDPTLVGFGYNSSAIIGRHPNGMLVIDDILDESNSSSDRELESVKKILTGTLFYCITHATWTVVIGTPWNERDVIAYCKSTDEFICINTPAYREVDEEVIYAWPEMRGEDWVKRKRNTTPTIEFARMVLLDLSKAKSGVLKFRSFPYDRVRLDWVCSGGVDYASSYMPTGKTQGGRSHFALAYVFKTPMNNFVVWDGILEQCGQAEAEQYIRNAQVMFPGWQGTVIEGDGKGEEFVQVLQRNPGVIFDMKKTGGKGKEIRLEKQMSMHFESGRVMIADAPTKFLNALRYFFDNYPNIDRHHPSWDAADSVYWALRGFPEIAILPDMSTELPYDMKRKHKISPWNSLGAQ